MSLPLHGFGRDGALRRPSGSRGSFRPLDAGGDIAARCPYLDAMSVPIKKEPLRRAALVKRNNKNDLSD